MASGSRATTEQDLREAAARGESTPISLIGWLRIAVRVGGLLLSLLVYIPLHYVYRTFAYGSPFPKLFLAQAAHICGARVEIVGTPLKRDVFFIANHISWLDILALAGASGTAFVSKAELRDVPVVGWLATLNRTVFVKRENRLGVADQINSLREALADSPDRERPVPTGIVNVKIDPDTGLLASSRQRNAIFEYFREDHVPRQSSDEQGVAPGLNGTDDLVQDIF